jgi:uncharacterized protein (TIGR02265 family)
MKIKGNILLSRLAFVRQHFGDAALEKVISSLSHGDQVLLRGMIGNVGWYSFDVGRRLDEAIVRELGGGDSKVFEEIGAASARTNLSTVHKLSITRGNPQAFLSQAPVIYSLYYDTGRREYQRTGPNSGVLTTYDAESFSAADCLTVVGWYKEALRMCGARNVEIVEENCRALGGEFCRYNVRWESVDLP